MCTKFDGPSWNDSVSIVFTRFVDRPTDRQTDRHKDGRKPRQTDRRPHHTIIHVRPDKSGV